MTASGVFLSYASPDRAHARLIARDLSVRGVDVWYDRWDKGVLYTLLRTGQCYLLQGDFTHALGVFRELRDVLRSSPDGNVIVEAERLFSKIDETRCPADTRSEWRVLRDQISEAVEPYQQVKVLCQ